MAIVNWTIIIASLYVISHSLVTIWDAKWP